VKYRGGRGGSLGEEQIPSIDYAKRKQDCDNAEADDAENDLHD